MNKKRKNNTYILGISRFYHDSSVTLVSNEDIVCEVHGERFFRKKNEEGFPRHSIEYCLQSQKIDLKDINYIIYNEKPLLTFERLLETYLSAAPRGMRSSIVAPFMYSIF